MKKKTKHKIKTDKKVETMMVITATNKYIIKQRPIRLLTRARHISIANPDPKPEPESKTEPDCSNYMEMLSGIENMMKNINKKRARHTNETESEREREIKKKRMHQSTCLESIMVL